MTKHIAPHLWADAIAGRLSATRCDAIDRHAASCSRCARDRDEVRRAVDAFAAIRQQVAPAVGWDTVRARVHWSVSTAKHRRVELPAFPRGSVRTLGLALGAAALVTGGVVTYLATRVRSSEPAVAKIAPPPPPASIDALVTRLAGEVLINGVAPSSAADAFARKLGAGTVLATGEGRIDIQFGDSSGLALWPRSTLKVVQLDAATIQLDINGLLDIDVRPRAAGERFIVAAGDHSIEVRGTRFLVEHDTRGTRVACHHGLVAVAASHRSGAVAVEAARAAFFAADGPLTDVQPAKLSEGDTAQFARSGPWTTPVWPDILAHSGPLSVVAAAGRQIRVDGIEVGAAPLQMRVMLGRHTIETADADGRFHRAGWVDVRSERPATFEVVDAVARPTNSAVVRRKKEFAEGIDRARLLACTRRLAKSGLSDTMKIEISVDTQGAVNALNIIDTDLPTDTATCVHDVLSDVRFGSGAAATWRDQIEL